MTTPGMPTVDDRLIWDAWMSMYHFPAVLVADELGVFQQLSHEPATPAALAQRMQLSERGIEVLLPMLAGLGFVVARLGAYQITDSTRHYLLPDSPFYWGGVLSAMRGLLPHAAVLRAAVRHGAVPSQPASDAQAPPSAAWAKGQIDLEPARAVARFMHSHSLPAALGVARHGDFALVRRLLDIGAGSGCFSIALAQRHPGLRCTLMELPAMCQVALEYVATAGLQDRIEARAVDMFRQEWPSHCDAAFLSNILHDWNMQTCAQLLGSAHAALPAGGRIYLHEMLLDDSGTGPLHATSFSVLMLAGTQGRQYSFAEFNRMLTAAGFTDITVTQTYGYYSLVSARKPSR